MVRLCCYLGCYVLHCSQHAVALHSRDSESAVARAFQRIMLHILKDFESRDVSVEYQGKTQGCSLERHMREIRLRFRL